jgi:hypothetical protein
VHFHDRTLGSDACELCLFYRTIIAFNFGIVSSGSIVNLSAPLISISQMYSQGVRYLSVLRLGKNYTHRVAG